MNVKGILIGSASVAALMAGGAPMAHAQSAQPAASADAEVVVTGIRQSLQKAIELKRRSDDQVDAISAEDIGKLPDKNVADALQRLPGINTTSAASGEGGFDENDRVSIRGTSPSLTQVTVDGHTGLHRRLVHPRPIPDGGPQRQLRPCCPRKSSSRAPRSTRPRTPACSKAASPAPSTSRPASRSKLPRRLHREGIRTGRLQHQLARAPPSRRFQRPRRLELPTIAPSA